MFLQRIALILVLQIRLLWRNRVLDGRTKKQMAPRYLVAGAGGAVSHSSAIAIKVFGPLWVGYSFSMLFFFINEPNGNWTCDP